MLTEAQDLQCAKTEISSRIKTVIYFIINTWDHS